MSNLLFNRALRILIITNTLILVAGAMFGPIYALFVERIGGDLLDASLTGGIFALVAGITTLFSGRYSDKLKEPKKIIAFGYSLMALGFFLYLFVNSIYFLFSLQVLIGFGEAIYSPAFDSVYSKHLTNKKEGKEWSAWESLNYFSAFGGAVIGGLIATYLGFNVLFIIMSLLSFVSALYILFLPKKIL
jgi:predicted MFS family arabinose efflux permease